MTISPTDHVSDIVTAAPATIAVFQRHHIEFCCAGRVPLAQVCMAEGLDLDRLIDELTEAVEPVDDARDWRTTPLSDLVNHIQATYHRPLEAELPRLSAMLAKVVDRHGRKMPDVLFPLRDTFATLARDLTFHVQREDAVLFPAILRLASQPDTAIGVPHPLRAAVSAMTSEHADTNDALATMRSLTSGYEVPLDACPTFRGLYYGLDDLEQRTRLHVRLEEDILFPRALDLGRPDPASLV